MNRGFVSRRSADAGHSPFSAGRGQDTWERERPPKDRYWPSGAKASSTFPGIPPNRE
jgi:hypothetical protein